MLDRIPKKWLVIILLAASILVHFLFFGKPNQIVFDEVHFGKFISAYYTHQYYFDIHPPLGKLMIAGFAKLFDFQPEFSFANIGEPFPDSKYMVLRFLPSLAGALLPIILFLLALELGFSRIAAFTTGVLAITENALLTQSRYILLDAFLLAFGFAALLFYFRYHNGKSWRNLIGFGAFAGLSMSIKWTGLTFLALPIILELFEWMRTRRLSHLTNKILCMALLPLAIYTSVFAVHFALLTKSGDGDAFMSQEFQSTLKGSTVGPQAHQPNFLEKMIELNVEMYTSNQRLTATHPYGSKWYTWPFMVRPIFYWVSGDARIYLLGNPVSWWASTLALIVFIGALAFERKTITKIGVILITGYILNLLPFLGISRVMFLYHYLTALIFAHLLLVHLIDQERQKKRIFAALMALSIIAFIFFAPLSYGLSLSPRMYDTHIWLPSWK